MLTLIDILILAFATWRLADILIVEDGPWDIVLKFRNAIAMNYNSEVDAYKYKDSMFGKLFACIRCMSVWVGAFWMLMWLFLPTTILYVMAFPFAFSGAAILIDRLVYREISE